MEPLNVSSFSIKPISAFRSDARNLIQQLNSHNLSHCAPKDCHLMTPEEIEDKDCTLLGAFAGSVLVGIGAICFHEDYAEVKRMFVLPKARGTGVAEGILSELSHLARSRDVSKIKLETSQKFKAAVRFYEKNGFTACSQFGSYIDGPMNYYMEKTVN